jgi:hypothetical protein
MTKLLPLLILCSACVFKPTITSFKEQLEYPGIQNGTTIANYTIEIENKKKQKIEVEGIWVKGHWITFTQKSFSGNPIIIRTRAKHNYPDSKKAKTKPPTKNKKHQGVIKFKFRGEEKTRFLGIEKIIRQKALARP